MRPALRFGIFAAVPLTFSCGGMAQQDGPNNSAGASSVCLTGNENCDCRGNGTCNPGLECRSNLCIAAAGGGTSTGGATSTGGFANAGGAGGNANTDEPNMPEITKEEWAKINDESCSGWVADGEMVPANIEFIVDTSGSMKDVSANTSEGRSKWEITRTALEDAFNTLPRETSVGMLLWPNKQTIPNNYTEPYQENGSVSACVNVGAMVPMDKMGAVGSGHRNALAQALDAVDPKGGTPTADAYNYAIDNNFGNQPQIPGNNYAVFITDGPPNIQLGCMGAGEETHPVDYQPVLDAISSAFMNVPQVKTFVIGSPGSDSSTPREDDRYWLSEAAREGGTSLSTDCQSTGVPSYCHFDVSEEAEFASGFSAALERITDSILECRFPIQDLVLAGQVVNPDHINVIYEINGSTAIGDMRLVGRASDPSCPEGNGWYLAPRDATGNAIQLCSMTCQKIQQDAGAVISIHGGCVGYPIIN